MDCKQWNVAWVAYLYDECTAEERAHVEAHLASCDACREHMDGLDAAHHVEDGLQAPEAPASERGRLPEILWAHAPRNTLPRRSFRRRYGLRRNAATSARTISSAETIATIDS